jgi:hypothetical protein
MTQHHQNKGGFGTARPIGYSPENTETVIDTNPSDTQPPGVDEDDEPQSLEEALTGL